MLQADWFQVSRSFGYFPTPVISGDFLELGCMNPTLSDWEERKHPRGHLAIQRSKAEPLTWPKFEGFVATVFLKGSTIGTSINFIWIF